VKKVTVFETIDGHLTKNKEEARARDEVLNFKKMIEYTVQQNGYSGMGKESVIQIVVEHLEEIKKFFIGVKK
jgi:hypothetical protein